MLKALFAVIIAFGPTVIYAENTPADFGASQGSGLQSTNQSQGPSDPQTGGILQPAGQSTSDLQSAGASGGGIAQSPVQNLQQTGSSDEIKIFIQGEGEQPQQLADDRSYSWLAYLLLVFLLACAITGALVWLQHRRA